MSESEQLEESPTCATTQILVATDKHQKYNQSAKGCARTALRSAKKKARRRADKLAKNRNRFIDNFGQRCGSSTRSAGITVTTRNTQPCPLCPAAERLAARSHIVELCPACGKNWGMPEPPQQFGFGSVWDEPFFYIKAHLEGRFPRVLGGPKLGQVPSRWDEQPIVSRKEIPLPSIPARVIGGPPTHCVPSYKAYVTKAKREAKRAGGVA
jgi:hypothetical protein